MLGAGTGVGGAPARLPGDKDRANAVLTAADTPSFIPQTEVPKKMFASITHKHNKSIFTRINTHIFDVLG